MHVLAVPAQFFLNLATHRIVPLSPWGVLFRCVFRHEMGPLCLSNFSKFASPDLKHLGTFVWPSLSLFCCSSVCCSSLICVSVVNRFLRQVRLIIFHEEGTLVVVFLHEDHGSFRLGPFASCRILSHDFLIRHATPALCVGSLAFEFFFFFTITFDAFEFAQPPLVVFLFLVALFISVLVLLARVPINNSLLLLLQLFRHDFARFLFARGRAHNLHFVFLQLLPLNTLTLLQRGPVALGHEHGFYQSQVVLLI
mmetsp:Transcript_45955/g.74046  ORF Transcript_45955/g.74046 Transcript_45955/m.74046 type:complete len:253 (-) Transcript_45955:676-1434(-)